MSTLEDKQRDVFLSKAGSRKELAATLHEIILPLLQQNAHNLQVAKMKIETLETQVQELRTHVTALQDAAAHTVWARIIQRLDGFRSRHTTHAAR